MLFSQLISMCVCVCSFSCQCLTSCSGFHKLKFTGFKSREEASVNAHTHTHTHTHTGTQSWLSTEGLKLCEWFRDFTRGTIVLSGPNEIMASVRDPKLNDLFLMMQDKGRKCSNSPGIFLCTAHTLFDVTEFSQHKKKRLNLYKSVFFMKYDV